MSGGRRARRRLEAAVVVGAVAVVLHAASVRIERLQADAERAAMERVVAELRTAVAMADALDAARVARGAAPRLHEGANPVDLLTRPPRNYAGAFRDADPSEVPGGRWFFDESRQTLVYRVLHADQFEGGADGVTRARFKIATSSSDGDAEGAARSGVGPRRALTLRAVEPWRWRDGRSANQERNEG